MDITITKEELRLHRELWDWLSHRPTKSKGQWPGWRCNGGNVFTVCNQCFLCEVGLVQNGKCNGGERCPADWSTFSTCCSPTSSYENRGYYTRWRRAMSSRTKKKYALLIRDIPMKSITRVVN